MVLAVRGLLRGLRLVRDRAAGVVERLLQLRLGLRGLLVPRVVLHREELRAPNNTLTRPLAAAVLHVTLKAAIVLHQRLLLRTSACAARAPAAAAVARSASGIRIRHVCARRARESRTIIEQTRRLLCLSARARDLQRTRSSAALVPHILVRRTREQCSCAVIRADRDHCTSAPLLGPSGGPSSHTHAHAHVCTQGRREAGGAESGAPASGVWATRRSSPRRGCEAYTHTRTTESRSTLAATPASASASASESRSSEEQACD